jgi:hypothetical protein
MILTVNLERRKSGIRLKKNKYSSCTRMSLGFKKDAGKWLK